MKKMSKMDAYRWLTQPGIKAILFKYDKDTNEALQIAIDTLRDELMNETNDNIPKVLSEVSEMEQDVIKRRLGMYPYKRIYTLEEIGKEYNVTGRRIMQIMEKAQRKMLRINKKTEVTL